MKITRRRLLIAGGIAGGGLLLGLVGVGGYIKTFDHREKQQDTLPTDSNLRMVTQWVKIGPDGHTTLLSPHTEMGQGANTGLLQILMDEMDLDPEKTTVEVAPALKEFANGEMIVGFLKGMTELSKWVEELARQAAGRGAAIGNVQFTGGSLSIRGTGWHGIRHFGAAGREMMAQAGAAHLGVPVEEVRTENSKVIHDKSNKSVGYGEVAAAAALLDVPQDPKFKDPKDWKYIGKRFPRVDIPDKVFATTVFGMDYEVPNMRYAAVATPPVVLARVTGVSNIAELKERRGVEDVVVMEDTIAVVADNPWRAEMAARAAKLEYDEPEGGLLDSRKLQAEQTRALDAGDFSRVLDEGDADEALAAGATHEAEYRVPYLSHSPMEPMNATIWKEDGKVHVATGVQSPLGAANAVADALGVDLDEVVLHPLTMGGGFGRRGRLMNYLTHAARIHQQVGGAVKLIWSREADTQLSSYRNADLVRMKAKLDADGRPIAWLSQSYSPIGAVDEATPPYDIPNVAVETVKGEPALPYGFWRSVDASTHGFFVESFIDELAGKAGKDPVEYRLSLLSHKPRFQRVLRRAAEVSNWPKGSGIEGAALGVAIFESFGSIVAEVAEVSMEDGSPRVHNVWCVIDCGIAVNPDSVEAQIQGGAYYGLTAALYGEITLVDGKMQQNNFHNYRMVRFADAPRITVDILSSPDAVVGGAGEPGTPPIAPAVGNAIAALGERPRTMPFDSMFT